MNFKKLKLELFYIRKAFFEYKKGLKYLYNKYFLARKILRIDKILEKPINNQDLSIHTLTCSRDFIMFVWSMASFYQVVDTIGQLYIHNDGTLTKQDKGILNKFFPSAILVDTNQFSDKYLDELNKYPIIKEFRTGYPKYFLLKKLIDPYFVSPKKYHLFVDSDLLWLNTPQEIEQEIQNGCQNSLITRNYALHPDYTIHCKDGTKLNDQLAMLNSGIVLYRRDNFNLEKLQEFFNKVDTTNDFNSHFIEQAGYAYCLESLESLPYEKYTIKDDLSDKIIVKHYTGPRRLLFYIEGIEAIRNFFKSEI